MGSAALGAGGRGRWMNWMVRDAQHGSLSPFPSLPMVENRHLSSGTWSNCRTLSVSPFTPTHVRFSRVSYSGLFFQRHLDETGL